MWQSIFISGRKVASTDPCLEYKAEYINTLEKYFYESNWKTILQNNIKI